MDTHSYKGWLNSDSFMKRSFAILGYNMVASLIIVIPFYIIMFGFILLFLSSASRTMTPDQNGNADNQGKMMQQDATSNPDQMTPVVNTNLKVK